MKKTTDPKRGEPAKQEEAAKGAGCFKPFMVIMVIVIAALLIVIAGPLLLLALGVIYAALSVQ